MKVFTITEGLENLGALRTGGQGSVYKARRTGAIITAVKLIPTPIYNESPDDSNYRNFLNEVEKLKKVNEVPNPNVVKILNSGITESGSFPFIEMEYIDGPDLEELLKPPHGKVFTIKETIKVADQLACALSHCHGVGVRHGDIKSNNVKFNIQTGNYVLLDFGLAVMSDEQRRSSMRHAGAIEFMAPEQNQGQMLYQTDVYSFGVVLFELLAGQVPFPLNGSSETGRNNVMLQHMESPVPDLLTLRRQNLPQDWSEEKKEREMQVPDWLLNIIKRCLEKKPEGRYPDGVALHDVIAMQSLNGGTNAELQAENNLLKQKLNAVANDNTTRGTLLNPPLNNEYAKPSGVRLSKVAVFSMVFFMLLLLLFALSANRSASQKDDKIAILRDSVANVKAKLAKTQAINERMIRNAAAARRAQEAIRASMMSDSTKVTNGRKQNGQQYVKPKKRKKFLGIF
ncbi:serine/threonine protein kinase [Mucilaginibacter sp. KACC 22063]|uniref:serine/threonine protein kinase n=1 Tax=Mucilaginibacter sp. KACC 22063 TaxID=3025666 RepID=UPI0023672B0F|nr:serine/threonine-protein kinase [Mucilaginibacter sp. KACC 22063]WDF53630.1 serine/threonine-protein kinase [Mucilaginibacter sp. KACC 22063]